MLTNRVQLARFDINSEAISNMAIAVLPFPNLPQVGQFLTEVREQKVETNFPHRRLNNALLACTNSLTHGFEKAGDSDFWALTILNSHQSLTEPNRLYELIAIWAEQWARKVADKANPAVVSACERFLNSMSIPPTNWNWRCLTPTSLIDNYTNENALIFRAMPSLLATILHGQTMVIQTNDGPQTIIWRRVQGSGTDKTGLFLVSQPFEGQYRDASDNLRIGFFAYRLDFTIQTQAGRYNEQGKLKPWVFMWLSCQRYADESMVDFRNKQRVSVLMAMNQTRLDNWPVSSGMIRLQTEPVFSQRTQDYELDWDNELPRLLEAFKARSLSKVNTILANPAQFANLTNQPSWLQDEYYVIHSEGYKYTATPGKSRGHNHYTSTGFSNSERASVFEGVVSLLNGILIPNESLEADVRMPIRNQKLSCLWSREDLMKKPTQHAQLIGEAVKRSAPNGTLRVAVIYPNSTTIQQVKDQLKALLALENDELDNSKSMEVYYIPLTDHSLLSPLQAEPGLKPTQRWEAFRKAHNHKRDDWQDFLSDEIKKHPFDYALIDLGGEKTAKVWTNTQRKIRGAVREACITLGIRSQFMQTVQMGVNKDTGGEEILAKEKGRVNNTLSDLVIRQNGLVFGSPVALYQKAGLPASLAEEIDVVTLYQHRTTTRYGDVNYPLAVRLRSTGCCETLLHDQKEWISYSNAANVLGSHFSTARKSDSFLKRGQQNAGKSSIKLSTDQFAQFAANVITSLERPSIVVVEAEYWRNSKNGKIWPQLMNDKLSWATDTIDFQHVPSINRILRRSDEDMQNLLGVVRLRMNAETPQYVPVAEKTFGRDFSSLSSFYEQKEGGLLHYFSIGQIPDTLKDQNRKGVYGLYKKDYLPNSKDPKYDIYGSSVAFKHQQIVEMVPFFVRNDLNSPEGKKVLCRIPHFLRFSPAWNTGNTLLPYPMHLAKCLVEDYVCILGVDA